MRAVEKAREREQNYEFLFLRRSRRLHCTHCNWGPEKRVYVGKCMLFARALSLLSSLSLARSLVLFLVLSYSKHWLMNFHISSRAHYNSLAAARLQYNSKNNIYIFIYFSPSTRYNTTKMQPCSGGRAGVYMDIFRLVSLYIIQSASSS